MFCIMILVILSLNVGRSQKLNIGVNIFSGLPFDLLARASGRITGEVKNISRVVYDITSKPPATVEWE